MEYELPHLQRRLEMWITNGAELARLIDPIETAVTVYRPSHAPERLDGVSDIHGEGPVARFILPLRSIFE